MTDPHRPTAESPYPPEAPLGDPDPFDNAVSLPLTKEVNLVQLADEIGKAVGEEVHLAVSGTEGGEVLWVNPGSVDESKVSAVLGKHSPEEHYGVPKSEQIFSAVLARAKDDDQSALTEDEMHAAVLGLLRRVNTSPPRGAQPPAV
jgi:hypothetical protein